MKEKHYVIFYDISDTRRRLRIAASLEDFAYRIQYSVFEMTTEEKYMHVLKERLKQLINEEEDSLKIYELDENSWAVRESYGINSTAETEDNGCMIL